MRRECLLLLRVWRDGAQADAWRIRVEDMRTREVRHFATLTALHRFLDERVAAGDAEIDEAPS
jgi:hypothetical protein